MGYLQVRMAEIAPQVTERLADAWTYTPAGEDAVSITAVWVPDQTIPEFYDGGEREMSVGILKVQASEVASPAVGDTASDGTNTWAVKAIGHAGAWIPLQLVRYTRQTVGRGNRRHD